jgi:sugar phosphate isomerase/epimerase
MDLAVDIGASTVNFLSGFLPDGDTEGWRILIDSVKELCRYAESCGLNFAIHNHEATILDSAEKCRLFIDHVDSPCLRMTFDATNCHLLNGDVVREVGASGNRIAHAHLKGLRGRYPHTEFLVPGEGGDEMDFPAFARALGDIEYSGYVSVETFPRHRDDKDRVAYDMMHAALTALSLRG